MNAPLPPAIGLGTYGLHGRSAVEAVAQALHAGYRMLDTAVAYGNEAEVGEGLRRSGVPREAVFVQTKVPGPMHTQARASVLGSLERLGVEYLDSVLIHWPNPRRDRYVEAWRALVELADEGLVRRIGVSNFTAEHLERVISATGVTPAYNQVELHPYFAQPEARALHARLGIVTQAWSPLGRGTPLLRDPVVLEVAQRVEATPAQVVLAWHLAIGTLPVPKSATPARQVENLAATDVMLTHDDLTALGRLARPDGRRRADLDPLTHEDW